MATFEWNNYLLKKDPIGRGAYAKVYYGYHKETKTEIALKKILFNKLPPNVKDKVVSEIHILQCMKHKHIIGLYEYRFDGDYLLLVTEYCKDGDLEAWMKKEHDMNERMDIMGQIIQGMDYLHQNGILHRDIKPKNILLHEGVIKICDFGFSTMIKEYNQLFNTICGTPLYMSPELLFMQPYTMKSDIWALGILFYVIIYKRHPFGKLINMDDYRLKIKFPIHYPFIDTLDKPIIDVMKQMLSYQPENRPDVPIILNIFDTRNAQESVFLKTQTELDLVENNDTLDFLKTQEKETRVFLEKNDTRDFLKTQKETPVFLEKTRQETDFLDKTRQETDFLDKTRQETDALEKPKKEKNDTLDFLKTQETEFSEKELDTDKKRIMELEEHIFKLETIIKEKDKSYIPCCFNTDDTDDVTGRGRTNMGYEKDYLNVDTEYFTPTSSMPINIPKKTHSLSSTPSDSASSGKSKTSLSSSFGTFFNMLTKSFSK
jgi:serine/threonine protein kinase